MAVKSIRNAEAVCTRSELLEHVMRLTHDELLALPFLTCVAGSREYLVAMGRLLTEAPGMVNPGSPLHRWASSRPSPVSDAWLRECHQVSGSLWSELQTLRALAGTVSSMDDPLRELLFLREHCGA